MEGAPKALTVCALASERIIVRASNPGQFEQDGGLGGLGGGAGPDGGGAASHHQGPWKTDPAAPDIAYHLGRVGINTDQVRMAYLSIFLQLGIFCSSHEVSLLIHNIRGLLIGSQVA